MNKEYKIKLDLNKKLYNKKMTFNQFDENVNDFYIEVTKNNEVVKDLNKSIVTLVAIKPDNTVEAQFVEVENGLVYADLKPSMCDIVGNYQAKAMIVLGGKIITTDTINYSVNEDKIISRLNNDVVSDERFPLFTDALARLSDIESSEEQRMINEAERILSEENRKIEEAKRVEVELIRQHEEADRAKYDATRESNENIRKQNESIRLANETNRIDEEAKRVEEENKRKLAEEERNANYNFMTEDEERRRLEANAHKEAEVLRAQAEITRVNEEAKRRTTEQARVSAENTRVSNENIRKTNEETRQTNETHRVEAETQRQNRYNSFILEAEANASNFENYTNSAKVKEEERKSNELDRKSQEAKRVSNEVERISNENTRKANEKARERNETSRQYVFENKVDEVDKKIIEINTTKDNFISSINTKVDTKISEIDNTKDNFVSSVNTKVDNKISELDNAKSDMANTVSNKVNEVETRFNALTSKQQQDAEVIDARDGETSLKARLDRDIEKAKQVYVNVEGSHISTDSSSGYAKDVEILGNTVQSASNLADIRSVGDKVEGQELYEIPVLSVGKNIFNKIFKAELEKCNIVTVSEQGVVTLNGTLSTHYMFNVVIPKGKYRATTFSDSRMALHVFWDGGDNGFQQNKTLSYTEDTTIQCYIASGTYDNHICKFQIEEGTQATPYEPYIEDKLTILSPVQLEKGDILKEVDGVWGVDKNIVDTIITGDESNTSLFTCNDGVKKYFGFVKPGNIYNIKNGIQYYHITNKLKNGNAYNGEDNVFWLFFDGSNTQLRIRLDDSYTTKEQYIEWLKSNNILVKYITTQPQFIPLPHDQQVKLRTFAGKTNISFGCEIEGTIKAQVPKSLGATVNTHTEQIRSLNNELNRVKKLEESTVSTVVTESDFTTVEATNNGYFEDVKLEGKTLVNLATQPTNNGSINHQYATISTVTNIKPSTVYTYIIRNNGSETLKLYLNTNGGFDWFDLDVEANSTVIGKARTLPTIEGDIWLSLSKAETVEQNLQVVLLEGDHTQNPPNGYIEGLKSVGQDVDEISVESVNENLWNPIINNTYSNAGFNCNANCINGVVTVLGTGNGSGEGCSDARFISVKLKPNTTYTFSYDSDADYGKTAGTDTVEVLIRDAKTLEWLHTSIPKSGVVFTTKSSGLIYVRFDVNKNNTTHSFYNIQIKEGDNVGVYTQSQQDKKRLLYYNTETQTWEKPILREWDSIEKHTNGKYYYHQRSGEVVLNGSEEWGKANTDYASESNISFVIPFTTISSWGNKFQLICNPLPSVGGSGGVWNGIKEGITTDGKSLFICINKTKLPTQDVQGFKQWLQTNNETVVYQLTQEKVYECTNIDLITYANETNFIVESGALSPKTTLKVHSNISNVVSLLQKKVSLLESNIKASQEVQDMMILETDMRMLDIELALMEFAPMKLNLLGGSDMLRSATYFNFLKNHIINETYEKEYLENVMNKYLATGRINQDEYDELYKMLYPPVYDIELPIEY